MKSQSIKIGGHSFQIRSDADGSHLAELAAEVERRFGTIEKRGPRGAQEFRAMTMVAIVLADACLQNSSAS